MATRKLRAAFKGKQKPYESVILAFSPDGKTLASGGQDARVTLWDLDTGKEQATLKGQKHYITALAFSPDSKSLAWGDFNGAVQIFTRTPELPTAEMKK